MAVVLDAWLANTAWLLLSSGKPPTTSPTRAQFGGLNLESRLEAAAAEAGLGSPVLLHTEPAGAAGPRQPSAVSQQTPGLLHQRSLDAAAAGAEAAAPMVPVAALGAAAFGAAEAAEATPPVAGSSAASAQVAAQEQASEAFFTAREQQTAATGLAAGPTPQSTAASRP